MRVPLFLAISLALSAHLPAAPLRVLVSSDVPAIGKSFGDALKKAGAQPGVVDVPTAAQLEKADVLLLHRRAFEPLPEAARAALTAFAARGGGIVVVNGAIAAGDAAFGRGLFGGGWDQGKSGKFDSLMMLYVMTDSHPVVAGASPFDLNAETLFDLTLADKLEVFASAFTPKIRDGSIPGGNELRASTYDLQPQMWAFTGEKHRAVAILQGSDEALNHASIRAFVLRSIAWTAKREKTDELVAPAEVAQLRYPVGGPLRGADAVKQFKLQPGFVAEVVAEEPLINKPIAIQWDVQGRLWVAETPEYPNGRRPSVTVPWKEGGVLVPGEYERPAQDRISVLVDTNGDGKMDKKQVFYDGLELVTGFCVYGQGVIVVAQPHIVYLADTDGDAKADLVKPLYGGFSPGDTHFVANNFVNAADGWVYATTGSDTMVRDLATNKETLRLPPGIFRFRADGSAIESVASEGGNAFGTDVTSDMEIFHGKATRGDPVMHVVLPEWITKKAPTIAARSMQAINPGRRVNREDMPLRAPIMQIDQVGGYSAACSSSVYEGGAWPIEYKDTVFMTEPILDIIHHEKLVPKGPSFKGEMILEKEEWLRSTDLWFSPVAVNFGPDGAMYVLDFYTPVVTHNDTRGPEHSRSGASVRPDREHYFGRIYRIQHKDAPKLAHPNLAKADGPALVVAFKHPNRVVRSNALLVLMASADTVATAALPSLLAMADGEKFVPARIQALWALQRLGKLSPATFAKAAAAEEPAIRKNAMLIAEAGGISLSAPQATAALADPDERVRLAALRALGASPLNEENSRVLLAAIPSMGDAWAQSAAAAVGSAAPGPLLTKMLAAGDSSEPGRNVARSFAANLAKGGDISAITAVLVGADTTTDSLLAVVILEELGRNPLVVASSEAKTLAAMQRLLTSSDRARAAAVLALAAAQTESPFKAEIAKVAAEVMPIAENPATPIDRRIAAMRAVVAARGSDPSILPKVLSWIRKETPHDFMREVITSAAATNDPSVGATLAANYDGFSGLKNHAFDVVISRADWAMMWLDALEDGRLPKNTLELHRRSGLTHHPNQDVCRRAKVIFGRIDGTGGVGKVEVITKLLPEVSKPGNPEKGKAAFAASCALCHQLDGAGNHFGPKLDGMGAHPVADLLTHIVDPSLVVDNEHRTWNFSMKNGTQFAGIIASENPARIQLRQPGAPELELKIDDIAKREVMPHSLMPEGLESLGAEHLRDIISYIQAAGAKK
jgi:hypothetical protein